MFGQGIIWGSVELALGRSLSSFNNSLTWNLEYTLSPPPLPPLKRGIPVCEQNKNKEGFPELYFCISLGLIWTNLSNI